MIEKIRNGEFDEIFHALYTDIGAARERYAAAAESFYGLYGLNGSGITFISAPGRTEIGGNHTDHQYGRALAAAVDLDAVCVCAKNDDNIIRVHSQGFLPSEVSLSDLSPDEAETGNSAALVRGVAAWFAGRNYAIGGFDAYMQSNVPEGSGVSSSAAFEVAVGNALKALYHSMVSPVEIAVAGRYAENTYFGKPCGLLDQIASSVGGLLMLDFSSPQNPQITALHINLAGYELCVTNTGGSHAELTSEYAAVKEEMCKIAGHFGESHLGKINPDCFYQNIAALRRYGDRAVLRAMHFFGDNERVAEQAKALREDNLERFISLAGSSGESSLMMLQNVFTTSEPQEQGLTLALALSKEILGGQGACRVHGGGFSGTIQAYVPASLKERYKSTMESVFGSDCCHFLKIRDLGGTEVLKNGIIGI